MTKTFLVINKGTIPIEVYDCDTLDEAARIAGVESYDIHHSLKGTGRWDREDKILTVIVAAPDDES